MKILLVSVAALAAFTVPSLAADFSAPVDSSAYDWSGFYAGIFGGYGGSNSTINFDGGPSNVGISGNGGVLGGDIGANANLGRNIVVGGEGSLSWDNISGSTAPPGDGGLYSTNLNWMATLTAKLGFTVDRFLVYADAGGAIAGLNQGARDVVVDPYTASFDSVVTGWTAGVGAEYALTDALSVNLKYAYADFGTKSYDATLSRGDLGGAFYWSGHTASLSTQTITAGLNYKF